MRMLDDLKQEMERIERENERAYQFIEGLLIEYEEHGQLEKPLTTSQFKWLSDLHQKYCIG